MAGYGRVFARVYNRYWAGFARQIAPYLLERYEQLAPPPVERSLLDLCCGTGQLARYFLEHGYRVTGIDASEDMLHYARENAGDYLAQGQATLIQGDVTRFTLDDRFGLAVSTFDALNHLPGLTELAACFQCVYPLLLPGGVLIFDLNTRKGLRRWNGISIQDDEEVMIVTRGFLTEPNGRAWTRISGFIRREPVLSQTKEGDLYERFEETQFNTAFALEQVRAALLSVGWQRVTLARLTDLATPLESPEEEPRVFFVAQK